ncbi:hypothetical protein J437_LFUL008606 [Ladona fulva]|uniref:Homeobox domain-containing protein n=1 Tax=Ladona fulva TaxID=123851 RepID=A0A8K0KBF8_LADFU|nr:hypothetical protein J437_LFUL008606 [Ladona fulva]
MAHLFILGEKTSEGVTGGSKCGKGGSGSSSSSGQGTAKTKRVRTIFTPEQLERLEAEFERQQYMVGPERLYLASALQLTEAQVKVWFQNRRIKWRKQHLELQQQRLAAIKHQQQQQQRLHDLAAVAAAAASPGSHIPHPGAPSPLSTTSSSPSSSPPSAVPSFAPHAHAPDLLHSIPPPQPPCVAMAEDEEEEGGSSGGEGCGEAAE